MFGGIRQVLEETGQLLLTVPTPQSQPLLEFLAYRLRLLNANGIRDHKVYYDRPLLQKTLAEHGFEIEHYGRFQLAFNSFCVAQRIAKNK